MQYHKGFYKHEIKDKEHVPKENNYLQCKQILVDGIATRQRAIATGENNIRITAPSTHTYKQTYYNSLLEGLDRHTNFSPTVHVTLTDETKTISPTEGRGS